MGGETTRQISESFRESVSGRELINRIGEFFKKLFSNDTPRMSPSDVREQNVGFGAVGMPRELFSQIENRPDGHEILASAMESARKDRLVESSDRRHNLSQEIEETQQA